MKKTLLAIMMLLCISTNAKAQVLDVYTYDSNGTYTNIRNAPKGSVVDRIPTESTAMFDVETPRNGWWKIVDNSYSLPDQDAVNLKGSKTGYWIHYSVLGIGTRNYGGQKLSLRSKPSGKVVYSFTEEIMLRPVDIMGSWVKVKTIDGKHTGWIESEWLCGNPLTNCN